MKSESIGIKKSNKVLFRKCHICNHLIESDKEVSKCAKCGKAFLPISYFNKIYSIKNAEFSQLFESAEEAEHHQLIKGVFVVW
jgi:hypothetical protein